MTTRGRARTPGGRPPSAFACLLVALAILVRLAVPSGFMVAPEGASVPLVICTGHGALQSADSKADHGKAPARSQDVCPFSASSVAPGAPPIVDLGEPIRAVLSPADPQPASAASPGRGLAAPPPPSQAPPALLS